MPARKFNAAQFRSQLRQAQQKQQRAINEFNAGVRKYNHAASRYNSAARQHNARVRTNRDRVRRELARLSTSTHRVTFRTSVTAVQQSFVRVERAATADSWIGGDELLDLIETEAANSAATWNALEGEVDEIDDADGLRQTRITDELADLDPDFDSRWRGALYALNPDNPDAARHFCTSSRELVDGMLLRLAPDNAVEAALPKCERTEQGSITRRSRVRCCLVRAGRYSPEVQDFVDADLDNVVQLFREFNSGTHGSAGRFSIGQLSVIKQRVEDALLFLHALAA